MLHELAIALGLALLRARPRTVNSSLTGLHREDGLQEQHRLADALEVDVKVGFGEAEDDADIAFGEHDGIDENAAVGVFQGDDQREQEVATDDAADEVGAGDLVEHRADHLDSQDWCGAHSWRADVL